MQALGLAPRACKGRENALVLKEVSLEAMIFVSRCS